MTRPSSRCDKLQSVIGRYQASHVETICGDLLSVSDCARAAEDVDVIIHLAAGFDKSFAGAYMNSALATRNLIEAFAEHGTPKRFVNVSSFSVYSNLNLTSGATMDEECALEDAFVERNDAYGFGKRKQEDLVRSLCEDYRIPWVILRPGAVFGPGKAELSGRIGFDTFGYFVQVGGGHQVPLTYVDNCAEAIVLAATQPGVNGEIVNVVDDDLPTARQFLKAYKKKTGRRSVWVPYYAGYGFSVLWEKYSAWSKGQLPPAFNRRRCVAEWKKKRFSNHKLKERLGWTPRVPMHEAIKQYLGQFD